jgi:hypothetical protein
VASLVAYCKDKVKVKSMNDNPHSQIRDNKKFDVTIDGKTDIRDLEKKIKESEEMLIEANSNRFSGWIPLIISLGIVVSMAIKIPRSEIYLIFTIFGLLYFGFNLWRIYSAHRRKEEIESKLREYRDKIAKIQTSLSMNQ